jgi:hypothetical protein
MGSDKPRNVVSLRRPKKDPDDKESEVVVRPDLLVGAGSPFYNPILDGTPAQLRWLRSLRGYLTVIYGWRDLIPPDIFPPSEQERLLEEERDERRHAEWVKGALRCLLEGTEDAKTIFDLDGDFRSWKEEDRDTPPALARLLKNEKLHGLAKELDPYSHIPFTKEELRDQNLALELERLPKTRYALGLPEDERKRWARNKVALAFHNPDEKILRIARDRWKVTDKHVAHWVRTLQNAGELKR